MSKPTPGPWKAGHRTVTAPETEERLGLDVRLYGGNAGDNRANARLIAAAPELLEALREVVFLAHGDTTREIAIRNTAAAALAKALGCPLSRNLPAKTRNISS